MEPGNMAERLLQSLMFLAWTAGVALAPCSFAKPHRQDRRRPRACQQRAGPKKALEQTGWDLTLSGPVPFADMIRRERALIGKIVAEIGLKPE